MLKPSGHRLNDEHNQIIRKFAKKWNIAEAEALRQIIIRFNKSFSLLEAKKTYEGQ